MKNTFYLSLILCLLCPAAQAQYVQKTYGGSFADISGYTMAVSPDGGYLLCGSGKSAGPANANMLLVRINNSGDTLWTRALGGDLAESAYGALATTDGGFLITGDTYSFQAGPADAYLAKTDKDGTLLWSKTYGGSGNEDLIAACATDDGGFVLLGSTSSYGAGDFDIYLLRTDAYGDTLWTRTFGGAAADFGLSLTGTQDGGYAISGYTSSFGAGGADVFLLKTDSSGQALWMKTYGGKDSDAANFVLATRDGGFLLSGITHSFRNPVDGDLYLLRTDAYGDTLWTRQYGGSRGTERGYSAAEHTDGSFLVLGDTYSYGAGHSDIYLLHTDPAGRVLAAKTFGTPAFDYGRSIRLQQDGSYTISGHSSGFHEGSLDLYLIHEAGLPGNVSCYSQSAAAPASPTPTIVRTQHPVSRRGSGPVQAPPDRYAAGLRVYNVCREGTLVPEELPLPAATVFPNPALDKVFTRLNEAHHVAVYNLLGQLIYRTAAAARSHTIDLTGIPSGLYLVELTTRETRFTPVKIQVR